MFLIYPGCLNKWYSVYFVNFSMKMASMEKVKYSAMEPRDNSTCFTKRTNLFINYTGVNFDIQKHNLLCFLEFKKIPINLGFSILIGKFCTLGFTYNFVLRVYVVQWSYILFKLYDVDPYGTFYFL